MVRKIHSLLLLHLLHLLLLLLLSALLCVEATYLRTSYIQKDEGITWRAAQTYCREHHTDLVSIRNMKEAKAGMSWDGWIGLYRDDSNSEWKWSRGEETANYTIWREGEPQDGENCAYKHHSETVWRTHNCDRSHGYICLDERVVLVQENKTWEEALEHCRSLEAVDPSKPPTSYQNHLYDLASLQTEDDHTFTRKTAQRATTDEVWTGLRFLAGRWLWVGGETVQTVQYQNLPLCPAQQQHCGALAKRGTRPWETRDCMERKNFLCYRKPEPASV